MNQSRSVWDKIRERFMRRQIAYRACFFGDDGRVSIAGDIVLRDLAKICHAGDSTLVTLKDGGVDLAASAARAAQRDVFLHMARFLSIDEHTALRMAQSELP